MLALTNHGLMTCPYVHKSRRRVSGLAAFNYNELWLGENNMENNRPDPDKLWNR